MHLLVFAVLLLGVGMRPSAAQPEKPEAGPCTAQVTSTASASAEDPQVTATVTDAFAKCAALVPTQSCDQVALQSAEVRFSGRV